MKVLKSTLFFILGSAFLFSSCSSEDEETTDTGLVEKVLCVQSSEDESSSRAYVKNNDGSLVKIDWQDDDAIAVHFAGGGYKKFDRYAYPDATNKQTAYFSATITNSDNSKNFYVVYPYSNSKQKLATVDGGYELHVTIPTSQAAIDGTFDPAAGVQIGAAAAGASSLDLKHVCAYLYFTVKNGCTGISVSTVGNDNWHLAGLVKIKNPTSASTAITGFGNADDVSNTITLTGVNPAKDYETYYVAIVPTSGKNAPDVKVTVNYGAHSKTRTIKSRQFDAGYFYNVGTIELTTSVQ